MRLTLAALLVFVLGAAPGISKYAGPPPPDPALMVAQPAETGRVGYADARQLPAAAPWAQAKAKPATLAALLSRLRARI